MKIIAISGETKKPNPTVYGLELVQNGDRVILRVTDEAGEPAPAGHLFTFFVRDGLICVSRTYSVAAELPINREPYGGAIVVEGGCYWKGD